MKEEGAEKGKSRSESLAKFWRIFGLSIFFLVCYAALFVSGACVYMLLNWAHVSLLEVITQIKTLDGTSFQSLMYFLLSAVFVPAILLGGAVFLFLFFRKSPKRQLVVFRTTYIVTIVFALSISIYTWNFLDVNTYLSLKDQETMLLSDSYVDPWDENNQSRIHFPEEKKNLVLIYLESTEVTFADGAHGGVFRESVIPHLTELANQGEDFSGTGIKLNGSIPLSFTDWTAASMFATMSGLPYKISLWEDAIGEKASFFPGMTSLGDVLENEGYDQTFYCGSYASFGGRKLHLSSHGDFSFRDFAYYNALPEDDPNHVEYDGWWGYEDIHLFDFLRQGAIEKSKAYVDEGTPFHLMAITVDSHFGDVFRGDGHVYEEGEYDERFADQYSKAISYDDKLVYEYVNWFFDEENDDIPQKAKDDTVFVLLGDHPTMSKNYCQRAEEGGYQRKNYAAYLNAQPSTTYEKNKSRDYSPFDAFPTILGALGCEIDGNRLGLGSNLFSNTPTLLEKQGQVQLDEELQKADPLMQSLLTPNTDYGYLEATKRLPRGSFSYEFGKEENTYLFSIDELANEPEFFSGALVHLRQGEESYEVLLKERKDQEGNASFFGKSEAIPDGSYQVEAYLIGESGNRYPIASYAGEEFLYEAPTP